MVGTAHHQEAASTEARPTAAIRARQGLGKTNGVPKRELGNDSRKIPSSSRGERDFLTWQALQKPKN
jgi:hypothetical protein